MAMYETLRFTLNSVSKLILTATLSIRGVHQWIVSCVTTPLGSTGEMLKEAKIG